MIGKRIGKDGVWVNPDSGIKLNRADRRQMKKNADTIDRTSAETDRRFFERFPQRRFRMRLPSQVELDQSDIAQGKKLGPPPSGFRYFVVICLAAPGIRMKVLVPVRIGCELDDVDLAESAVAEIWQTGAPPEMQKATQAIRQKFGERP